MKNIQGFNSFKKLNENISDLSFETPLLNKMDEYYIKESEFAILNKIPFEENSNHTISNSDFSIIWELDIDARNWGIKNFDISIKKIQGSFTLNIWREGEDDDTEHTYDFNPEEFGFKIDNQIEIIKGEGIYPTRIEINFKEKTITIF